MNNPGPNPPVFDKCEDRARAVQQDVTLVEVTLRYKVRSGGQTLERIVKVDPQQCEGVLWTENASRDVTKFRFFSRLARSCWKVGSGRPDWVRIFQGPRRRGEGATATIDAPSLQPQQPVEPQEPVETMMFALSADAELSGNAREELDIDSGNCYYHNGRIICC
jgi:hypothetical protein